jgi:hypothetical protein
MSLFQEFKRNLSSKENSKCVDCGSAGPGWACVVFGVYVCEKCSAVHKEMDLDTSYIKSLTMDSWSVYQINLLVTGGNKRFRDFLNQFDLPENQSILEKYSSEAAIHYKTLLKHESEYKTLTPASLVTLEDQTEESSSWVTSTKSYFSETMSKVSNFKSSALNTLKSLNSFSAFSLKISESENPLLENLKTQTKNLIESSKNLGEVSSSSIQSFTMKGLEMMKEVKSLAVEKAKTIYSQEKEEESTEMVEMKSFGCIRFN